MGKSLCRKKIQVPGRILAAQQCRGARAAHIRPRGEDGPAGLADLAGEAWASALERRQPRCALGLGVGGSTGSASSSTARRSDMQRRGAATGARRTPTNGDRSERGSGDDGSTSELGGSGPGDPIPGDGRSSGRRRPMAAAGVCGRKRENMRGTRGRTRGRRRGNRAAATHLRRGRSSGEAWWP